MWELLQTMQQQLACQQKQLAQQQEDAKHREEDAKHRDEEARHWREEDAKRRAAWMEQLVLKLTRARAQGSPQPARGEGPTSESMVEGGTPRRRSTTTILGRGRAHADD